MAVSSENSKGELSQYISKEDIEKFMLALKFGVFYGLVVSAHKHLDSWDDKVTGFSQREMSMKAYIIFRVFLNRWTLKSKDKCIYQLVDALALSGCGGINLESQLENITGMLFQQLCERVNPADPHSVENRSLVLRAFFILAKLYQDQMVSLLLTAVESNDPEKMESAFQVFADVFQELPQTKKLQRMVLNSTILVIQEDLKPVPKVLVHFIEMLGQHNYLALPQGNALISYIIKLVETDSSNEEDIRIMCSRILQMVSLPKLVTLVCESNNTLAFMPLCKAATQMALKARSLGQVPYLSSFHQDPIEYISPQRLLTHLVMCSRKPYREKEFGTSSLRLLSALHPITSLHPVINHSVGQLWRKVIPQMLEILDDHTEKSLNQEEWEDRLFRFLSQSLVAIDDDCWQEQLIRVILERIRYFSDDGDEKAFLYKFFGFALWTSRSEKLVKMMLSAILQTSHENVQEREGIAVAFSVVSRKHLRTVLEQLQVYSAVLTDKESSSILTLAKEHQPREWVLVCHTIYLSYSKIILESKGDIFMHFDAVLVLILQHYHNCILEKDKDLKLGYLNALIILTKTLGRQQHVAFQFKFPHKLAIVTFMLDLIKEEPLNSISSPIRQKAMNVISNFRMFRPLLGIEERVELLGTCFKSVFCLPSIEVLRKEASSPKEGQANVDLFEGTMQSLLRLLETLIVEMPTRIQNCLQLMDPWLNSQKDNERERAMWCAARILEFTAKMEDFSMEIEFTQLGRLVKLLAMRCQDPVDSICFLSAKAVYHLYCILLKKKQMKKKIQGLWIEEGMDEAYSANLFYNNTVEIAEAFAEYFTQSQLTNLVLTAMEELTGSRAKVSLAAAQLMSAVMKKRGSDLIKVEEIVVGTLERLKLQLEPNTKEETLRALCLLAGNCTHSVVPLLLNRPLPWDRTILAPWRLFGTERKTTINVLQLLIGILENHSTEGTTEKALEPEEAAFALCEMLSGTLCREAILELYPRLLLASG
ncbi:maestro heat-like repeat-containing protein family member 1 [Myotis lucifugus]|uniref:maestro heat-like repeat-containing protein family member 1 n=1 Tax=Myotis lucifugus TaxID=59463 RepID=UPI000CCBFCF2|nr:maestro heat-like repeat-containing protein family member 1 [Myotis lucifugus]